MVEAIAGRGGAAVEVDGDAVAEHVLGVGRHDRGGLAGEVGARDGERAGLLEQLQRDALFAGMRTATVPCVSPRSHDSDGCDGQDDGEAARPERLDEPLDGLGHLGDEGARVAMPATSTGGGDWRPRPLASSRRLHGARR